jgi:hypothetical protein
MAPAGTDPDDPESWTCIGTVGVPITVDASSTFAVVAKPIPPTQPAYAQAIRGGTIGETWYLATCAECGDPDNPLPQPFTDPAERDKWTTAHIVATGHHVGYHQEPK